MANTSIKTIGKYALILTLFYGLEFLVVQLISQSTNDSSDYAMTSYLWFIPVASKYLLNIITALMINKDKKDLDIKGKYSVLLTIIYRPIGIVLFLIYVIEKEIKKSQHTTANHSP